MKRAIIATLACLVLTTSAQAQNLTRAQEGRVAVANCYGSCGGGLATRLYNDVGLKYTDVLLGALGIGDTPN